MVEPTELMKRRNCVGRQLVLCGKLLPEGLPERWLLVDRAWPRAWPGHPMFASRTRWERRHRCSDARFDSGGGGSVEVHERIIAIKDYRLNVHRRCNLVLCGYKL